MVNADDFGFNSSVNKAIVESFDNGLINSSTIMANMPGFDEAVELIHNRNLQKKIGVHLALTEGFSLTPEISSLNLFCNKKISSTYRTKRLFLLNRQERFIIYNEYSAQIEKVKSNGISITHLDTHHQIHDVWTIIKIMLELLKTYNIPSIRILNNLYKSDHFYKNAYRNVINHYLKARNANFTDFLGNQLDILSVLERNPAFIKSINKRIEIMVHPDLKENGLIIDRIGHKEYDFRFHKDLTGYSETPII